MLRLITDITSTIPVLLLLFSVINIPSTLSQFDSEGRSRKICNLPKFPDNGNYTVVVRDTTPNATIPYLLRYSCAPGYQLNSRPARTCLRNKWQSRAPKCLKTCEPLTEETLTIICTRNGQDIDCTKPMLLDTVARVDCKPLYELTTKPYSTITCGADGKWDHDLFVCEPVCGTVATQAGVPFIISGYTAYVGEFPWHVGIYRKLTEKFLSQICGGTIISRNVVISAAHCFWDSASMKIEDPSGYAVAAGKNFRDWKHVNDSFAQYNDVEKIVSHRLFYGDQTSWSNDIALLVLRKSFRYNSLVRPICIDWGNTIYKKQLLPGKYGLVAGWGRTKPDDDDPPDELQATYLPFIDFNKCVEDVPKDFRRYLTTGDKLCAGYGNETNVCFGDSGGGFTFETDGKHYLQGLVSIGRNSKDTCEAEVYAAFTSIHDQLEWIIEMDYLNRGTNLQTIYCEHAFGINCVSPSDELTSECNPPDVNLLDVVCSLNKTEIPCDKPLRHGSIVNLKCWQQHEIHEFKCLNGKYDGKIPQCVAKLSTCPPRESSTADFECTGNNDDCRKPSKANKTSIFTCKPFYDTSDKNPNNKSTCQYGSWYPPLAPDVPVCNAKKHTAVPSKTPWHITVFRARSSFEYEYISCGGSLITPSAVLTSASCFGYEYRFDLWGVAAGNYFPNWKYPTDTGAQYKSAQNIIKHPKYGGYGNYLENNIALIIVSGPFEITPFVRPAYIAWNNSLPDIESGLTGLIGRFGYTTLFQKPKNTFKAIDVTTISNADCIKTASNDFGYYVPNSICARRINDSDIFLCSGDVGAGLTIDVDGVQYLVGVLSYLEDNGNLCEPNRTASFEQVSGYLDWIQSNV